MLKLLWRIVNLYRKCSGTMVEGDIRYRTPFHFQRIQAKLDTK